METRMYELTVLLKPDLKEKELDKEVSSLQGLLTKQGVKVKAKKDPVLKPLAYEIAGFDQGYYLYLEVETEKFPISDWEAKIKQRSCVIRHLVVRKGD